MNLEINRVEMERKILQFSRQMPDHLLLEILHYVEFLNQHIVPKNKTTKAKRFHTMKVQQVIKVPREELYER